MNTSPQNDFAQNTNAYRELCCYLEHAPDAQLLCDHTAVLLFRIHDPALRQAGLGALRSQLYSRKLSAGRAESWFIDCEERIRQDMPGFLREAEQQFVRAGLDAEAAQMEAERAKKQKAKPRILPASAFAPEETEYLIEPYLPRGMLSILGGVSAAGKTSLALDIASAVSAGRTIPSQSTPDGVASSPRGGALGTPGSTARCRLSAPEQPGPVLIGSSSTPLPEDDAALSPSASSRLSLSRDPDADAPLPEDDAALGSKAHCVPAPSDLSSQQGQYRPASGSPSGGAGIAAAMTERATGGAGIAAAMTERAANVFYLTAENDPNKVLRPRCEAMGADLDHLYFQNGASLSMSDPELFRLCRAYRPKLVVFDPIQSFLGPGIQMNRAEQVRPLMDKLIALAKELDMAVLLISHMSKPGPGLSTALDRLLGSSDFRNAARSILIAGADPDGGGRRVFAHAKSSVGLPGPSQRYHIEPDGTVAYDGPCDLTADRLLMASADSPHPPRPAPTLSEAAEALDDLLGFVGWADYAQVERLCARRGFSERTMRRAKAALGLRTLMLGDFPNRTTYWHRSELSSDAVQADILNQHEQLTV